MNGGWNLHTSALPLIRRCAPLPGRAAGPACPSDPCKLQGEVKDEVLENLSTCFALALACAPEEIAPW
jgi:hypothetical protein